MELEYYCQFLKGMEEVESKVYGPYPEFIYLTYNMLRVGPDDDTIAIYDDDWWKPEGEEISYSDVSIWAEASKSAELETLVATPCGMETE
jgi:hypothetical protein